MSPEQKTVILWRPVGPPELELTKASEMREFPARLPEQPIFHPVTTEACAIKIGRDWNVPASGKGLCHPPRCHPVGGNDFQEYWIPAHQLQDFNNALIGPIEVVAEFGS
jgi:hypothetical protein